LSILACSAAPAAATSNHTYGPHEYLVIADGTAPNRQFSIAAHGNGQDGYDNFHLYLMAEPDHRRIGPLEEVGPDILDTGPEAYRAVWSQDSRHVGLFYRVDRHIMAMRLYRIQNRRAYPIAGDTLFQAVAKRAVDSSDDLELRSASDELTWLGTSRFSLKERRLVRTRTPELARTLGRFGKQQDAAGAEPGFHLVEFSAEAVCTLVAGDRYQCSEVKPGRFEE
jgi:hypothetical protein